ncbi:MAG: hypothetical protein EB084_11795, partial [Proteobacteria bacterium]|nr:hypothetical protein [Pseudomonadota bacterium]
MCNGSPHLDGSRLRRTASAGLALVLVLLVVSVASILSDSSSSYTLTATSNLVGNTNVTAPDGTLVPFGTVYLLSTGTYNSLSRKTRALVSIGGNTVYRYAAYAKSSIDMSSNANTDSYNSSNGAYNTSTNISSNGSVGTEGLLTLYSNTVIHGNTSAARYQLNGTAQITGTQGAAPNVSLPAIDFSGPQTSNNNGTGWTITGGTMAYNSSTKALTGRGTITFNQGGTYYFSSVNISANSNLVVSSSVTSPVKIYVLNDYTTSSNFAMNNQTQKP